MKHIILVISFAVAYGQQPAPALDRVLETVRQLSEEVRELKLELAAHRLAHHEERLREVETQINRLAGEQRQVEDTEATSRAELGQTELMLAGGGLPEADMAALQAVRNSLLTERSEQVRGDSLLLRQKEYSLRAQAGQEQAQINVLREKIRGLKGENRRPR